jgi:Rieske Fe-S protein
LQGYVERRWPKVRDEPLGSRRALLAQFGVAAGAIALTAVGARVFRRSTPAVGTAAPTPTGAASPSAATSPGAATSPTAAASPTADAPQPLAAVSDVPVGGVLPVTAPTGTAFLFRVADRQFVAFNRTCTHAGCQVDLAPDQRSFRCPCHGAQYDARTGAVLGGPAPRPLDQIPVQVSGDEVLPG